MAFAKRTDMLMALDAKYHHCASLALDEYGFCLAYYHGRECTDEQHVVIEHWDESFGNEVRPREDYARMHLGPGTGNPVVFRSGDETWIIYSQFTDKRTNGRKAVIPPGEAVERWKYCDIHLAEIHYNMGELKLVNDRKIRGCHGLLPRITPTQVPFNGVNVMGEYDYVVPMYREQDPLCSLWGFKDGQLEHLSDFGAVDKSYELQGWVFDRMGVGVAIQPSVVFGEDGSITAFCRNVCRTKGDDCRAWIFHSKNGLEWTDPIPSRIPNHNNSLVIFNYPGQREPWVVYSDERTRETLWLRSLESGKQIDLRIPSSGRRRSYSYPNVLIDKDRRLHVVHTNKGDIAWHVFDEGYINKALQNDMLLDSLWKSNKSTSLARRMAAFSGARLGEKRDVWIT